MTHKFENISEFEAQLKSLDKARFETLHRGKRIEKEDGETEVDLEDQDAGIREISQKALEDNLVVVNERSDKPASVVSNRYELIEHDEAFQPVVSALRSVGMDIEGEIKTFKDGNIARVTARFKGESFNLPRDSEYLLGFQAINSYDKSHGFRVMPYGERQVCSNGLTVEGILPSVETVSRIHIGNVNPAERFAEWFKKMTEISDDLKARLEEARDEVLVNPVRVLVNAGIPEGRAETIASHVERNFPVAENEASRYAIFNGVTWYVSHEMSDSSVRNQRKYMKAAHSVMNERPEVLESQIEEVAVDE